MGEEDDSIALRADMCTPAGVGSWNTGIAESTVGDDEAAMIEGREHESDQNSYVVLSRAPDPWRVMDGTCLM